jgi:hypothetical protein
MLLKEELEMEHVQATTDAEALIALEKIHNLQQELGDHEYLDSARKVAGFRERPSGNESHILAAHILGLEKGMGEWEAIAYQYEIDVWMRRVDQKLVPWADVADHVNGLNERLTNLMAYWVSQTRPGSQLNNSQLSVQYLDHNPYTETTESGAGLGGSGQGGEPMQTGEPSQHMALTFSFPSNLSDPAAAPAASPQDTPTHKRTKPSKEALRALDEGVTQILKQCSAVAMKSSVPVEVVISKLTPSSKRGYNDWNAYEDYFHDLENVIEELARLVGTDLEIPGKL